MRNLRQTTIKGAIKNHTNNFRSTVEMAQKNPNFFLSIPTIWIFQFSLGLSLTALEAFTHPQNSISEIQPEPQIFFPYFFSCLTLASFTSLHSLTKNIVYRFLVVPRPLYSLSLGGTHRNEPNVSSAKDTCSPVYPTRLFLLL